MDIRQINYMLAIASEGSLSRAAASLYITQSALDQQLIKLERELGTALFVRSRGHLIPTEAGRVYIEYAQQIRRLRNEAYQVIGDISDVQHGELSIAFGPERGMDMFVAIYPEFYRLYPDVSVVPRMLRPDVQLAALQHDELDMSFSSSLGGSPNLVCTPLADEEFVLLVPAGHRLAAFGPEHEVSAAELKGEKLCLPVRGSYQRDIVDRAFAAMGLIPNTLLETESGRPGAAFAACGLCCAVVPEHYAHGAAGTAMLRLPGRPIRTIYHCVRKGRIMSRPAQCFAALAAEYCRRAAGKDG